LDKTKVMVEFSFSGDSCNPKAITKKLNLDPDWTKLKGDLLNGGLNKQIENVWEIKTEYEESLDINNQILPIIEKLRSKAEIIKKILNKDKIDGILGIVIKVENGQFPSIYLKSELINFLSETGIEISFDIYHYS